MRNLVLALILLLALFTIIRAYAGEGDAKSGAEEPRLAIYPGVVEFRDGEENARLAFGVLDASGEGRRTWNIFPVRISLQSDRRYLHLGLNGLAFATGQAVSIGKPLRIRGLKRGDVLSIGGEVEVEGTIEGSLWSFGADIRLLPGSTVTGDVVALGGTIEADRKALIQGGKEALPNFRIPLLGLLTSEHSAAVFLVLLESLRVVLFLILLFLLVQCARPALRGLTTALASGWRDSLLALVLGLLIVPILTLLLVLSILGVLMVPFLFVLLVGLAYLGYLGAATRLGLWIRGLEEGPPAFLYTSGLLGLLVLKGPVFIGLLLSFSDSDALSAVGRFLTSLGTAGVIAAVLFGLGGSLTWLRRRAEVSA